MLFWEYCSTPVTLLTIWGLRRMLNLYKINCVTEVPKLECEVSLVKKCASVILNNKLNCSYYMKVYWLILLIHYKKLVLSFWLLSVHLTAFSSKYLLVKVCKLHVMSESWMQCAVCIFGSQRLWINLSPLCACQIVMLQANWKSEFAITLQTNAISALKQRVCSDDILWICVTGTKLTMSFRPMFASSSPTVNCSTRMIHKLVKPVI